MRLALLLLALPMAFLQDHGAPRSVRPVTREDPWWRARHEAVLASLPARAASTRLVFVGDSITQRWEDEGPRAVWDRAYAPHGALNLGFSGDCTEHVLWRLENGELEGLAPRVVVLLVGTNNAGHRDEPARDTAAGVAAILRVLGERLPAARVLLLAILPRGATDADAHRRLTRGTNRILTELADRERVVFLDLGPRFVDDDGALREELMPDGLHLSTAGYRAWAAGMEPTLARMLGEAE